MSAGSINRGEKLVLFSIFFFANYPSVKKYGILEIVEQDECCRGVSNAGIELMNLDAKITEDILSYFVNQDIPVLSIHDSYLVPMGMEKLLKEQMQTAFGKVMGIQNVRLKEETHNPWDYELLEIEDASTGWEEALKHRSFPEKTRRYESERQKFCRGLGR